MLRLRKCPVASRLFEAATGRWLLKLIPRTMDGTAKKVSIRVRKSSGECEARNNDSHLWLSGLCPYGAWMRVWSVEGMGNGCGGIREDAQ